MQTMLMKPRTVLNNKHPDRGTEGHTDECTICIHYAESLMWQPAKLYKLQSHKHCSTKDNSHLAQRKTRVKMKKGTCAILFRVIQLYPSVGVAAGEHCLHQGGEGHDGWGEEETGEGHQEV